MSDNNRDNNQGPFSVDAGVMMIRRFYTFYLMMVMSQHPRNFCSCANYTHTDNSLRRVAFCHNSTIDLICKSAYRVIKIESAYHGNIFLADTVQSSCNVLEVQRLIQISASDRCTTNIVTVSELIPVFLTSIQ